MPTSTIDRKTKNGLRIFMQAGNIHGEAKARSSTVTSLATLAEIGFLWLSKLLFGLPPIHKTHFL